MSLDLPKIKRLYVDGGLSLADVAKQTGCCNETVRKRLREMGVQATRRLHQKDISLPDDETAWAYLAGLVDGEGSIIITKRRNGNHRLFPTLQVSNTSIEIMDWLVKNFGGSYYSYGRPTNPLIHSNVKMSYWKVSRIANLSLLLPRIEPYLVLKRKRAMLAIKICHMYNVHSRGGPVTRTESIKHLGSHTDSHMVVGAVR